MDALTAGLRGEGLEPADPGTHPARRSVRDGAGRRWVATVAAEGPPARRLRRRARALTLLEHPHLVRTGRVLELPDGGVAVLQEEVPGADLATVGPARRPWSPGEVVTVLVPLAEALAALHAVGQVHGDVAPGNVMLTPDGRPVLVDTLDGDRRDELGTPGMAAPERAAGATPAGDVHALARLGLDLLGPVPAEDDPGRRALVACLRAACATDPAARPTAEALAGAVSAACPPTPVTLPDPAVLARLALRHAADPGVERTVRVPRPARRRRGRHRRGRRWTRVGLLAGGLAVVLVAGGLGVRGIGRETAVGEVAAGEVAVQGPRQCAGGVVHGRGPARHPAAAAVLLTVHRARALASGDSAAVACTTVPGSPAARADELLMARLRVSPGSRPTPTVVVQRLEVLPPSALPRDRRSDGTVGVRITVRAVIDRPEDGRRTAVARTTPPEDAGTQPVDLLLRPGPSGWRVTDVRDVE